jgi:integrase/recombinase XerD
MTKLNVNNIKVRRRYLDRLRQARGLSEATVVSIERALHKYDEFIGGLDYKTFSTSRATAFKKWLQERQHNGKPISAGTAYHVIRQVHEFFMWLSGEQGYRSKITPNLVSYLSLDLKTVRQATSERLVSAPSLEYVLKLTGSIEPQGEVDLRDRALIAFLLLSGMRVLAVVSLPIGCLDPETLVIDQSPSKGVKTKFGKTIISRLLPFDTQLMSYVLEWHKYLTFVKLYTQTDPLFPSTRMVQAVDGPTFEAAGVEPIFWSTADPVRRILRERSEHAQLPYHNPHSFRHAAIQLGFRFCKSAEATKALSQNVGHKNIDTTLATYGNLSTERRLEVLGGIDFTGKNQSNLSKERLREMIAALQAALGDEED